MDESWRVKQVSDNARLFKEGLNSAGFDTMNTQTAIVPILCKTDQMAYELTREGQMHDIFVLPVVSPAVPEGLARLRTTVTATHTSEDILHTISVLVEGGKRVGLL